MKLFAVAKELAGSDRLEVELPAEATIADLRRRVAAEWPALARVLPHALWAVDEMYACDTTRLAEKSTLALIPPVSGG